jgi:hypothetical protein
MTASFRGGRFDLTPRTLSGSGRQAVYAGFTRESTGVRVGSPVGVRLSGPLVRVVLVSEHAGNVRHHAQRFTLLDQMWVR